MAYHTYTTEGVVLKTTPAGEANIRILFFSRDLGLIRATVQGARLYSSKLRYGIQEYTYARAAFVRGKTGWCLTSVEPHIHYFVNLRKNPERITLMAKAGLLIRRLSGEDDVHPQLFAMYKGYLDFLLETSLSQQELIFAEYISALRVLRHLGYVGSDTVLFDAVHTDHWNDEIVRGSSPFARDMIRIVNTSIEESQL